MRLREEKVKKKTQPKNKPKPKKPKSKPNNKSPRYIGGEERVVKEEGMRRGGFSCTGTDTVRLHF